LHLDGRSSVRMEPCKSDRQILNDRTISDAPSDAGDVRAGTAVVVTSLIRLKAAPPHFAAHVEAPAPNIIMRRSATSERTLTPAKGVHHYGQSPSKRRELTFMRGPPWRRYRSSVPRSPPLRNPDQLRRGDHYRGCSQGTGLSSAIKGPIHTPSTSGRAEARVELIEVACR
jgi:hypothetical protein